MGTFHDIDVLNVYRTAAKLEWGITYWLLKDKNGFVSKEVIRGMYDGSIFDYISKQVEAKRGSKSKKTL